MSVLYSLYDALVSINVPNDKARAVVDAMEMDMLAKLATKSDLVHLQELFSRDIKSLAATMDGKFQVIEGRFQAMDGKFQAIEGRFQSLATSNEKLFATKVELAELGRNLTTRIYVTAIGSVALTCSILGTMIALH